MGIFDPKPGPGSAITELTARAANGGVAFAGKRFPWIVITPIEGGIPITSAVYPGYGEANRPAKPMATGVEVKKQGELGTTRRATVKFTCFTDNQLNAVAPGLFAPGRSCKVEWGWSVRGAGTPVGITSAGGATDVAANKAIRNASATNPSYDGLQGVISNFNYSLTADNLWDCSVEIVAAAENIMNTPPSTYGCAEQCAMEYEGDSEDKEKTKTGRSTLYTMFKQIFEDFDAASGAYIGALGKQCAKNGVACTITKGNYMGPQRTEKGEDDSSWYESTLGHILTLGITAGNDPDATEAYISYGTLEAAINEYSIPKKGEEHVSGRLATGTGKMYLKGHPKMNSADPRVCIIPGSTYANTVVKDFSAPSAIVGGGVDLNNILLNNVFLMKELDAEEQKSNPSLKSFIMSVLNKVNDVCGGLWGFEVVSGDSEDDKYPTVCVVDVKAGNASKASPAVIPSLSDNSIVREITLSLKLTDSMKTQALYAKTGSPISKNSPSGGNCDAQAVAAIGLLPPPKPAQEDCTCEGAGEISKPLPFSEAFENLAEEVTDDTVEAARTAMLGEILKSPTNTQCQNVPVPLEFSVTLDGVGGFGFGQLITSDRIPESVRSKWNFQITAVEHSVTAQDWVTKINTVARFKG